MKLKGYAGKILHVDLTTLTTSVIDTDKYQRWGGGHGLGAALFWDLCKDFETIEDGRDERNVVTLATSPFSGTNVPSAGGRTEVTGIGCGLKPKNWFARSNFGGQFSAMLKHAGWDAVTITGKAPYPVYLDIRNDKVMLRDAAHLWGKDTYETQQMIQQEVSSVEATAGWAAFSDGNDIGRSTQKAAVVTIGPAGENDTVHGALIHGKGHGAGQCGFGSILGFKNLKAISAMGTGSVEVHDPAALLNARFKVREHYAYDNDATNADHIPESDVKQFVAGAVTGFQSLGGASRTLTFAQINEQHRSIGCHGCINGCKHRRDGYGSESHCQVSAWYMGAALLATRGAAAMKFTMYDERKDMAEVQMYAAELTQRLGINSFPLLDGIVWLAVLAQQGLVGPGKTVDSSLRWDLFGTMEFAKQFCEAIAYKTDIGVWLADGFIEAAKAIGREDDVKNNMVLQYPYWGGAEHGYDPREEHTWGFATLMDTRDVNDHGFNWMMWHINYENATGTKHAIDAKTMLARHAEKLIPYAENNMKALDFSKDNIYSEHIAQAVRWQMHYNRFYKNSLLLCDFRWPDFYSLNRADNRGATADPDVGEQVYWNAITGENMSFAEGMKRGQQVYNLDNAIWTLQGRHRDMAVFEDYIYDQKKKKSKFGGYLWPCSDGNGGYHYEDVIGRKLDRQGVETWKDHYYRLEEWDISNGWPTRTLLEKLDMKFVADRLEQAGKLGVEA